MIYTFYFCRPDGSSTSAESFDLVSRDDAELRAAELLTSDPACAYVAVWRGDTPVLARHRTPPHVRDERRSWAPPVGRT